MAGSTSRKDPYRETADRGGRNVGAEPPYKRGRPASSGKRREWRQATLHRLRKSAP